MYATNFQNWTVAVIRSYINSPAIPQQFNFSSINSSSFSSFKNYKRWRVRWTEIKFNL